MNIAHHMTGKTSHCCPNQPFSACIAELDPPSLHLWEKNVVSILVVLAGRTQLVHSGFFFRSASRETISVSRPVRPTRKAHGIRGPPVIHIRRGDTAKLNFGSISHHFLSKYSCWDHFHYALWFPPWVKAVPSPQIFNRPTTSCYNLHLKNFFQESFQ